MSITGFGRTVYAPDPITPTTTVRATYTNVVLSVTLMPGEQVEWIWTSSPDGGRYVSGYTVHKRDETKTGA